MNYCYLESPVGRLLLVGDADALREIRFPLQSQSRTTQRGASLDRDHGARPALRAKNGRPSSPDAGWTPGEPGPVAETKRQLREYFAGQRTAFDLPLAPEGTPFQRSVWRALEEIPYGETISYGELARRVGNPQASRAVGAANGRNPLPIVIPCHRVIGASGKLTGFGGGLPVKEALLALERSQKPLFRETFNVFATS